MVISMTAFLAGAFFLGGIPFSFLFGRARGVDIRTLGSGNVGATNLTRALGLRWGVVAFLADASKGWLPVLAARECFPEATWLPAIAGCAAVIGHCFSPFLRFRGGKGVATGAGVVAALNLPAFLLLVVLWGSSVWAIRNVGVASSVTALGAACIGLAFLAGAPPVRTIAGPESVPIATFLLSMAALVIIRHRKNLARFFSAPKTETKA